VGGNGSRQRIHGRAGARHHHQTARVLVQPVHDARARQLCRARVTPEQAIEQRTAPVSGRGMHDEPGGLVDHQQMLVFMHHIDRYRLGVECLALLGGAHLHPQQITGAYLVRGLDADAAIELHGPLLQQLLQVTARELGHQQGKRLVQAQPVLADRDGEVALLALRRVRLRLATLALRRGRGHQRGGR